MSATKPDASNDVPRSRGEGVLPTIRDVPGTKTRYELADRQEVREDPNGTGPYVAVLGKSGHEVYKNRSHYGYGYKTHLTREQRRLIRWALRQRDLGHSRQRIVVALLEKGYKPGPGQYPLSRGTIASWELTRAAMDRRGLEWPTME